MEEETDITDAIDTATAAEPEKKKGNGRVRNRRTKRSKRYKKAIEGLDRMKVVPMAEAMETVKKFPAPKFDQTITVSLHMGVDPRKSDQMIRGSVPLPHGSGQLVRVLVFAQGEAAAAAEKAGAEFVGYEDMLKKVKEGFTEFDVAVATPDAMAEVRKLGRVLGPRGLMPNPKTGTVTDDTAKAVQEVKAGRVDFKLDKNGNIAVTVGKASFEASKLADNAEAVIDSVVRAKPATAKGTYIETVSVAATMTPSVKIDANKYAATT